MKSADPRSPNAARHPLPLALLVLSMLLLLLPVEAARKKLPSFLPKCPSAEQEALNACALQRAKDVMPLLAKGIPEMKIPPLEPYTVERIVMEARGVQMIFTNFVMRNFFDTKITNVEVDLKARRISLDYENPKTVSTGIYSFEGDLAGFPLRGTGNSTFIYHNIKAHCWMKLGLKKNPKDGLDYPVIEDSFLTFTPSKVEYWFDNLFGGDPNLGKATNGFLNDNWPAVFEETKETIFEAMKELVQAEVSRLLKDVPYNEIFPE